ncbi:MAG: transglutaminase-like domain-containing protein [Candidatus Methanoplasma sp.]|jgi:hypothetical protein|nr:transglutaminase-like domain-containing protein [Candidatus Methanoplasma sp.]
MNLKSIAPVTVFALVVLLLLALPSVAAADEPADKNASYRSQLDANGKALYDAVKEADAETFELTVVLPMPITAKNADPTLESTRSDLADAVNMTWERTRYALWVAEPMAIWFWHGSDPRLDDTITFTISNETCAVSQITLKLDLTEDCPYQDDPSTADVNERQQKIDAVMKAVGDFESASTDVRGKVGDINRYLVDNVTYDPNFKDGAKSSPYDHDAYGALVDNDDGKRYAVCEGYAKAFQLLADKLGIPCMTVFGTATPSLEAHAWNYVKMDNGNWYAVDSTWNDSKGNAYLLVGYETFFQDHQQGTLGFSGEVMPFNYPKLSDIKYDDDPRDYMQYSWVAYAVIGAIIVAALYTMVRRGSN